MFMDSVKVRDGEELEKVVVAVFLSINIKYDGKCKINVYNVWTLQIVQHNNIE